MSVLALAAAGVVVPLIASEVALAGTKVQTGLARVLVVWTGTYLAATIWLSLHASSGVVALAIFWGGAFLVWLGVRSHLESSILLRMLVLLRQDPMTDGQLTDTYSSVYGESKRLAELLRAGLIVRSQNRVHVTPKGKAILLVVSKLR